MFQKFLTLFTFLGVTTEPESNQNGIFLDEETLTKIDTLRTDLETRNAELATANAAKETAETGAATLQAALTETETKLTAATTLVSTHEEKITELKAELAQKPLNKKNPLGNGSQSSGKQPLKSVSLAASQVD